jgi:hypothetical protein
MDELRMRSYSEEILDMLSEEENDSAFTMTNRDLTNLYLKRIAESLETICTILKRNKF